MTTREKILVGLMCLAIAYGAYELMGTGAKRETKTRPMPGNNPTDETRTFVSEVTHKILNEKVSAENEYLIKQANADWNKDPFIQSTVPLRDSMEVEKQESRPVQMTNHQNFVYTGFLMAGNTRLAIINGIEYATGESLNAGGYLVGKIAPQYVILENPETKDTIQVPLNDIEGAP